MMMTRILEWKELEKCHSLEQCLWTNYDLLRVPSSAAEMQPLHGVNQKLLTYPSAGSEIDGARSAK